MRQSRTSGSEVGLGEQSPRSTRRTGLGLLIKFSLPFTQKKEKPTDDDSC